MSDRGELNACRKAPRRFREGSFGPCGGRKQKSAPAGRFRDGSETVPRSVGRTGVVSAALGESRQCTATRLGDGDRDATQHIPDQQQAEAPPDAALQPAWPLQHRRLRVEAKDSDDGPPVEELVDGRLSQPAAKVLLGVLARHGGEGEPAATHASGGESARGIFGLLVQTQEHTARSCGIYEKLPCEALVHVGERVVEEDEPAEPARRVGHAAPASESGQRKKRIREELSQKKNFAPQRRAPRTGAH